MSTFLYKLGKAAYSKPWYFIAGWIVILGIVIAMLGINGMSVSSEIRIEGTEAQKVLDKLEQELPQASGGQASVVFTAPEGERLDTPERVGAIVEAVNEVYGLDYVINPADFAAAAAEAVQGDAAASQGDVAAQAGSTQAADQSGAEAAAPAEMPPYMPLMIEGMPIPGVLIATDGSIALFQFQFTVQNTALPEGVTDSVIEAVNAVEAGTGITALPSETLNPVEVPIGTNEIYGLVIAVIVLIVSLGSIVAAGLPVLVALFGVGIGVGGAFAISSFVTMNSITPVLALMVGLAVGIDYALFIVNRQRRLIFDQGLTAKEAAGRAIGTAGSAVFFAGLTVIIALCGLLVIGLSFLSMMALVASFTVFLDVLIALTLLPALLGLVGERICSPKSREKSRAKSDDKQHGIADRWVKGVIKLRWLVILGVIVVLGVAALPVGDMRLGIPSGASANLDTTQRQSYDAIAGSFGEGFNGPLLIVAEPKDAAGAITQETLYGLVGEIQGMDNVSVVSPLGVGEDGKLAILNVIPGTGPTDEETKSLVEAIRDQDSSMTKTYDVSLGVTGFTAINIDMSAKLAEAFPIYIVIIVILSLIILLLVFRSILVPVKATVGFLLSVLATFGITTAVYQWGWFHELFGFDTGGPVMSFMPILVTGILYGLAMDYQVFLVSSMRESYVHGYKGRQSVIHGYDQASRVVVAAAIIMVSVFAGFIFTHDIMIKQIGFALAIGILLDAFVIRMALVPAVMSLFGDKAWWLPKWLDRLLPNLDVEGDKLIAELKEKEGVSTAPKPKKAH